MYILTPVIDLAHLSTGSFFFISIEKWNKKIPICMHFWTIDAHKNYLVFPFFHDFGKEERRKKLSKRNDKINDIETIIGKNN